MFEQAFRNIDDALRKEAGCATELDYSEQTSYLHKFKARATRPKTIEYKIGEIFGELKNKITSATTSARSSSKWTNSASAPRPRSMSSARSTRRRSSAWARRPKRLAQFFLPRHPAVDIKPI